ncbi:MAG TPA: ribosome maturation factor RimM [Candidatus Saccharicenans sp.]|nr:16S rRNA processing protein RimM [Candidatus Saccharicenans sp.]HRD01921.1 ribosome maturation factor RimM [Candidatus Saccharicenans sp.]
MKRADLVTVGRVLRGEGKDGTLKVRFYPWIKEPFFKEIFIEQEGECRNYKIERYRQAVNSSFLKLEGVNGLEAAEAQRGREIMVHPGDLPRPTEGMYYDFELLGCRVETLDGQTVGTVTGLNEAGSLTFLMVESACRSVEIPFVEAICRQIELDKKLIIIDPPEGLLDLNEI